MRAHSINNEFLWPCIYVKICFNFFHLPLLFVLSHFFLHTFSRSFEEWAFVAENLDSKYYLSLLAGSVSLSFPWLSSPSPSGGWVPFQLVSLALCTFQDIISHFKDFTEEWKKGTVIWRTWISALFSWPWQTHIGNEDFKKPSLGPQKGTAGKLITWSQKSYFPFNNPGLHFKGNQMECCLANSQPFLKCWV